MFCYLKNWILCAILLIATSNFNISQSSQSTQAVPNALQQNQIADIAFSPIDSNLLASVDHNGVIKLWDTKTGKVKRKLAAIKGYAPYLEFPSDGKTMMSSAGSTAQLWDTATWKEKRVSTQSTETEFARHFELSRNGKFLVSRTDKSIRVYDAQTSQQKYRIDLGYNANVKISPDNSTLLLNGRFRDIKTGKLKGNIEGTHGGDDEDMYSPDGRTIMAYWRSDSRDEFYGNNFTFCDGKTGAWKVNFNTSSASFNFDFSPDNKLYALSYSDDIELFDSKTMEKKFSFKINYIENTLFWPNDIANVIHHENVCFAPDSKTLAIISNQWKSLANKRSLPSGSKVELLDTQTGKLRRTLETKTAHITSTDFSSNCNLYASGHTNGTIILWNASTGKVLHKLTQ